MDIVKSILDKLPANGYKAWIGFVASALILGLQQLGTLDGGTADFLLKLTTLWTGVALLHKEMKANPA